MERKQASVEALKTAFVVLFVVGLAMCFLLPTPFWAFVVFLVGVLAGGLMREVKYRDDTETIARALNGLRPDVDANHGVDAFAKFLEKWDSDIGGKKR